MSSIDRLLINWFSSAACSQKESSHHGGCGFLRVHVEWHKLQQTTLWKNRVSSIPSGSNVRRKSDLIPDWMIFNSRCFRINLYGISSRVLTSRQYILHGTIDPVMVSCYQHSMSKFRLFAIRAISCSSSGVISPNARLLQSLAPAQTILGLITCNVP